MRSPEDSMYFEALMPDGSWKQVHLEQLDIGDVIRCRLPGQKDFAVYKDDRNGQDTTQLTMLSQAAYRLLYGDYREAVLRELLKRSQSMPGDPPVIGSSAKDPRAEMVNAPKSKKPRVSRSKK